MVLTGMLILVVFIKNNNLNLMNRAKLFCPIFNAKFIYMWYSFSKLKRGMIMDFVKKIINNRKLILQLGMNNFKNRFANTSLGVIWGFIQPFVFMFTYAIVFQFILKVGNSGNDPYIVWFIPGMSIWQFINESILTGSGSIRNFSYLVKKVVFPVDVIPAISFCSSAIVGIFLMFVSVAICLFCGYFPNLIKLVYIIVASTCFIVAVVRLTSAVCTLVPDFEQLLSVGMQLLFWFTPIIWSVDRLTTAGLDWVLKIINCMPFAYLVNGFRSVFLENENILTQNHFIYTIIFWVITIIIYVWGNKVFKKSKKDFADVL